MSKDFGTAYVWKNEHVFKVCFIYKGGARSYLVLNDRGETKQQVNDKIEGFAIVGYKVVVGLPPEPKWD